MSKVLLLTDYRGTFYSNLATQRTLCSMDLPRLRAGFAKNGYDLDVQRFSDVDLAADLRGVPVIYTSSEDIGLHYKSYIEDIVLTLESAGANVIPGYALLRAHHNKTMMEALRYRLFPEEAARLQTRLFGTYEELAAADLPGPWPKVIKSAYGAGSTSVAKAGSLSELLPIAKKMSRSLTASDAVREVRSRFLWKGYSNRSLNRNKFIVQNMVPNLAGDFKVLRYGSRMYALYRANRPGDFRASGSGKFSFDMPAAVPRDALLNYAERAADRLGTPLASMDIGYDGTSFTMIEFQCLHFGTYAAERSPHYYSRQDGGWTVHKETCDLEGVLCSAVIDHLHKQPAALAA